MGKKSDDKPRILAQVRATALFKATRYDALPAAMRRALTIQQFRNLKDGAVAAVQSEIAAQFPDHFMEDRPNGNG